MKGIWAKVAAILIGAVPLGYGTFAYAAQGEVAEVRAALEKSLRGADIVSVRPAPVEGLWEVVFGKDVVYAEPGGRYVIVGSIYDLKTSTDLTAERKADIHRIPWETLPLDAAIVRGSGSRKVTIVADPDCPFCRRLYHALAEVEDVTVYEIMYPLSSLHPEAREKSVGILCAEDPNAALAEAYDRNRQARSGTDSDTCREQAERLIDQALAFGRKEDIRGTPVLIRSDGRRHSGFMPPERIDAWLGEAGRKAN